MSRSSKVCNLPFHIQIYNVINLLSVLCWVIITQCIQFRNRCFDNNIYRMRSITLIFIWLYFFDSFFTYCLKRIFKPILNGKYEIEKQNVIEEPVVKRGRGRPRVTKQPKEPQKKRKAKNWKTTYDSPKEKAKAKS